MQKGLLNSPTDSNPSTMMNSMSNISNANNVSIKDAISRAPAEVQKVLSEINPIVIETINSSKFTNITSPNGQPVYDILPCGGGNTKNGTGCVCWCLTYDTIACTYTYSAAQFLEGGDCILSTWTWFG